MIAGWKFSFLYSAFLACSLRPGAVVPVLSRSAAHRAAPQVLVKAKKMPAIGTISRRVAGIPKLSSVLVKFKQKRLQSISPGVRSLLLLDMFLLLRTTHALELEVAGVRLGSVLLALEDDKGNRSKDRDEVERQVHNIPNNR